MYILLLIVLQCIVNHHHDALKRIHHFIYKTFCQNTSCCWTSSSFCSSSEAAVPRHLLQKRLKKQQKESPFQDTQAMQRKSSFPVSQDESLFRPESLNDGQFSSWNHIIILLESLMSQPKFYAHTKKSYYCLNKRRRQISLRSRRTFLLLLHTLFENTTQIRRIETQLTTLEFDDALVFLAFSRITRSFDLLVF